MAVLTTDAIVLHAFDYSETSRIVRLATRDAGVQSALARGARRSRGRFATALDLFAQGNAHLYLKDGRDLQTLSAFESTVSRPALGADLDRFTGAAVVGELVLRFGTANEVHPALFDALALALDRLARATPAAAPAAGLAGAWHIVAQLGFAPALDACAACHAPIAPEAETTFSHAAGGVLCESCRAAYAGGRRLPAAARALVARWVDGGDASPVERADVRAHQRLLREFLLEHVADARPLRAFEAWEQRWSGA